jgi:altronate hydrolase
VGTSNYWLVVPLVFCENRNLEVLKDALVDELGYGRVAEHTFKTRQLIEAYKAGADKEELLQLPFEQAHPVIERPKIFPNVDGVRFLTHDGGCGGTRQDAEALCALLAGYIAHPNVAGATVFSLGCQHAQISILQEALRQRMDAATKPVIYLEQQQYGTEAAMMDAAIRQTFAGMAAANELQRAPAPLSALSIGLECGGSDGFSGISANPVLGYVSDCLVALGGQVILSEFPELCGVEQELCDRCVNPQMAYRFQELMETYNARAVAVGSGFDRNPSPGNIRDGLITDAIKSAGAARKGGNSPVQGVWDYGEMIQGPGLHLLCTPGNDVESTTAEVGSGANLVLFTTGLGTPTGNPIVPVIKVSSNSSLAIKMPDIIDFNAGTVIDGTESIAQAGERLLRYLIEVASGNITVGAVRKDQWDFIPWKRGVSL